MSNKESNYLRGGGLLLFGALAGLNAVRLHGTPAFLSGLAGGVLLVLGIARLARKKKGI
jgi:hypothetical protein